MPAIWPILIFLGILLPLGLSAEVSGNSKQVSLDQAINSAIISSTLDALPNSWSSVLKITQSFSRENRIYFKSQFAQIKTQPFLNLKKISQFDILVGSEESGIKVHFEPRSPIHMRINNIAISLENKTGRELGREIKEALAPPRVSIWNLFFIDAGAIDFEYFKTRYLPYGLLGPKAGGPVFVISALGAKLGQSLINAVGPCHGLNSEGVLRATNGVTGRVNPICDLRRTLASVRVGPNCAGLVVENSVNNRMVLEKAGDTKCQPNCRGVNLNAVAGIALACLRKMDGPAPPSKGEGGTAKK